MNPDSQKPARPPAAPQPQSRITDAPRPKEDENQDPVGQPQHQDLAKRRMSEGDKPVGASDNDGSSPYEEPHHRAKNQRDR